VHLFYFENAKKKGLIFSLRCKIFNFHFTMCPICVGQSDKYPNVQLVSYYSQIDIFCPIIHSPKSHFCPTNMCLSETGGPNFLEPCLMLTWHIWLICSRRNILLSSCIIFSKFILLNLFLHYIQWDLFLCVKTPPPDKLFISQSELHFP
jgi:hypothetical protein